MLSATAIESDVKLLLPRLWLEQHGDRLYAYAIQRVRHQHVAEDLLQETLLAALNSSERFSNRSAVRTWLIGILRNKLNDHFRERYRHERAELTFVEDEDLFNRRGVWKTPVPSWNGDPSHLMELSEFRAVLDACISKLPTRMAHLFLSRVADGATTAELCRELEITDKNAWMLLHRARGRLRDCLTRNWFTNNAVSSPRRSH